MAREAVKASPDLSRRSLYQMAKREYLKLPSKERESFSIFN